MHTIKIIKELLRNHNDNKLVLDTYDLALKSNPEARPLFHSDRGYQYKSKVFQRRLEEQGITRVGCCINNSPTEGCFKDSRHYSL